MGDLVAPALQLTQQQRGIVRIVLHDQGGERYSGEVIGFVHALCPAGGGSFMISQ